MDGFSRLDSSSSKNGDKGKSTSQLDTKTGRLGQKSQKTFTPKLETIKEEEGNTEQSGHTHGRDNAPISRGESSHMGERDGISEEAGSAMIPSKEQAVLDFVRALSDIEHAKKVKTQN